MDLAAGLFRLLPGSSTRETKPRSLAICPSCASELVQPQGWHEPPGGSLVLSLRCPECFVCVSGSFDHDEVAEYDELLVRCRQSIEADYLMVVRHNMEELAERFGRALELDLIGADDFTVPRALPVPATAGIRLACR